MTITADSAPVETADEQLNLTLKGAVGGCCDENGKLIKTPFDGQISLVRAANIVSILSISTTRRADLDAMTRLSMHRLAAVSKRPDTDGQPDGSPADAGGDLTGFGATRTAWEAQHGPEVPDNYEDAYGTQVDDERYEYSSVSFQPRVLSYTRAFSKHTTLAEAETILLRDFPSDAHTSVNDDGERRCRIVLIESPRLQDVLGDWATASFYGRRQAFDADDVAFAFVTVHASRRARDLGGCS